MPKNVPEIEAERKNTSVSEAMLICCESPNRFDFDRLSTVTKAYRIIAWVLRFMNNARRLKTSTGELDVNELKIAKRQFLKILQLQHFRKEIALLEEGKRLTKDSKLIKLDPFLDEDGLLRVRGRIQLSELAFESKHPIILPKCHGSQLLIRAVHLSQNHALRLTSDLFSISSLKYTSKRSFSKSHPTS